MSDWEKDHIAAAFAFELNQVVDEGVRDRTMNEILVNIDEDLADHGLGGDRHRRQPAGTPEAPTPSAPTPAGPLRKDADKLKSPALSMDKPPPTIKGRKIAVLVGDGVDTGEVEAMLEALAAAELVPETIGPRAGTVAASDGPDEGQSRRAQRAIGRLRRRARADRCRAGTGSADAGAALRPRSLAARQADRRGARMPRSCWRRPACRSTTTASPSPMPPQLASS